MNILPLLLVIDSWVDVSGTIVTAIAAIVAIVLSYRSLHLSRHSLDLSRLSLKRAEQASYADVLFRLDQEMRVHQSVHLLLRPGGAWEEIMGPGDIDGAGSLPVKAQMPAVEAYMGLFERVNYFVDQQLIDIKYVEHFYGYRYVNIYCNPVIHQKKLIDSKEYWKDFIALGEKLDVPAQYGNELMRRMELRKEWKRQNLRHDH